MNIQPIGNRVLIRREVDGDITDGGIIIPESAKQKANIGVVLAVGEGKIVDVAYSPQTLERTINRQKSLVHKGDRILFSKYSGHDFEHNGETLLFLREDEVLAVIE